MSIDKATSGKWKKVYVGPICLGVGADEGDGMSQIVCNSILPDTDEEYEESKDTIETDMALIASSKDMYLVLQEVVLQLEKFNDAPFVYLKRIASEALPKL